MTVLFKICFLPQHCIDYENLCYLPRRPSHYEVTVLPTKLPPRKQPVPITSLPMLGYLEQTAATAIINALSSVGSLKPKFPFLDSMKSALIYVACHLKGMGIIQIPFTALCMQQNLIMYFLAEMAHQSPYRTGVLFLPILA